MLESNFKGFVIRTTIKTLSPNFVTMFLSMNPINLLSSITLSFWENLWLVIFELQIKTAIFNADIDQIQSQKLLDSVKRIDLYYIKPEYYESSLAAIDSVRRGRTTGAIIIGKNFSYAIEERLFNAQNNSYLDEETVEESELRVYVDNSNYIYAQFLIDSLTQTVWQLVSDILVESGRPPISAPIQLKETIYAPNSKLSDFLLPGYMIAFIYLSQVTLSSILLINEREDGLFDRAIVAGAGHGLVFASHFITGCLMSALNVLLMLTIAFIWFDITNYGSLLLIVILVMTQAANAISLGNFKSKNRFYLSQLKCFIKNDDQYNKYSGTQCSKRGYFLVAIRIVISKLYL